MAWIESHDELPTHPKTRKAARQLEVSIPTMIGHLHMLWWWCLTHRPDGVLEGMDDDDVADAAAWEGDPATFVKALLSAHWLDRDDGEWVVHDWWDGAGKTILRRRYATERQRRARESRDGHGDVTRDSRESHGADSDSDSDSTTPPTPQGGSRANGTNPRAVREREQAEEARMRRQVKVVGSPEWHAAQQAKRALQEAGIVPSTNESGPVLRDAQL